MANIAAGDMSHRLPSRGPTEVRYLAEGVNRMLDSILASEREISARRDKEYELKNQLHQSEKLAAIGRFAAGVAHELGTPLSVADGKAQRALRRTEETHAQPLQDIRQQLQRMGRIIRQLMDFARPVVPERRDVRIEDMVQSSLQQVEDERKRHNVDLQLDPGKDCPPITADRLRLEQALINLLRNAIQAAPEGKVKLSWYCSSEQGLVLGVEDNGPGIDQKIRSRLLEPFVTTKPVGVGTGLGLAVVNAVVAEHGGIIEVEQSALGGALFRLTLPFHYQSGEERA